MSIQDVIRQTRAHYCLDCGKCTAVCPVNRFDPQFSPRLIVQKALSDSGGAYADARIWQCVGCNMCMVRCNYNVSYVELIRHLRMQSRLDGTELVYSHGGITESVMHMMGHEHIRQERNGWLPAGIEVNRTADTAFFVGCAPYFDTIFKDLGVKLTDGTIGAVRLLNAAGVPFNLLDNERCCGHDQLWSGDLDTFHALAGINLELFRAAGARRIVTTCPECARTLKVDYPRLAGSHGLEVVHIAELLAGSNLATLCTPAQPGNITYQDPCRLGRHLGIYDAPRKVLADVGFELIEMDHARQSSLCCGTSCWTSCGQVSKNIQVERLAEARATGAGLLVTACVKCQIHFKCAQADPALAGKIGIHIRDLATLVAERLT